MKVKCSRCGNEIEEKYPGHYTTIRGVYWRKYLAYGKIRTWRPCQNKSEVPRTVLLCKKCYDDFERFLKNRGVNQRTE